MHAHMHIHNTSALLFITMHATMHTTAIGYDNKVYSQATQDNKRDTLLPLASCPILSDMRFVIVPAVATTTDRLPVLFLLLFLVPRHSRQSLVEHSNTAVGGKIQVTTDGW